MSQTIDTLSYGSEMSEWDWFLGQWFGETIDGETLGLICEQIVQTGFVNRLI